MIKVRVKGEGVKLANRWCFINDEAIIDEEEFEKNKEYVDIIEKIEKPKADPEVPTSNEEVGAGENQNPEDNEKDGSDTNDGTNDEGENVEETQDDGNEDEELEALKERAKELGIKNTHNMKKETLIAKIQETEEASTGEGQNPEGE